MSRKPHEEARLTRYLLGEVSERERERLEEEYFADDDAFEQMLVAEDELVDAYASGELPAEERRRFEESFLNSPRGRERVRFARSLAAAVSDARPAVATAAQAPLRSRLPFFGALRARGMTLRFALPAAALVVVVGLTWPLFDRARMREELRQLRAEREVLTKRAQESERRAAGEQARREEMLAQLEAAQALPTPEAGRQGDEAGAQQHPPRADRVPRGRVKKDVAIIARRVTCPGAVRAIGQGESLRPRA